MAPHQSITAFHDERKYKVPHGAAPRIKRPTGAALLATASEGRILPAAPPAEIFPFLHDEIHFEA